MSEIEQFKADLIKKIEKIEEPYPLGMNNQERWAYGKGFALAIRNVINLIKKEKVKWKIK